jgi:chromosome segregation ATPase
VVEQTYLLSSDTADQIEIFLRNPTLSPAGKQALGKIQALKAQIAAVVQSIQANQSQTAGLVKDQERLRENIRSLNSVTGQEQQVQRYARDLAERETRIVALRDQLQAEQQKRAALESELNAFLANVTF